MTRAISNVKNLPQWVKMAFLVVLGIGIGGGALALMYESRLAKIERLASELQKNDVRIGSDGSLKFAPPAEPLEKFKKAAETTRSAVVYISTKINTESEYIPDLFSVPQEGSGSGVIVDSSGYLVTNYHVIENAQEVTVSLNDKRSFRARVLATNPNTDLALLKVNSQSALPTLPFGDSEAVKVGQWVLAVGNPFNLNSTVTAGIISAKARNIGILRSQFTTRMGVDYSIESFLQTDAVVNPGNSGGALVDLSGKLIGINTAIATENGSYSGYSFAIPSGLVQKVTDDLIHYGAVQRGFMGVSIQDITLEMIEDKGLSVRRGAYIVDISEKGAAAQSGIQAGDVITHINDQRIESTSELQEEVAMYRPGDQIKVTYLRDSVKNTSGLRLLNMAGEPKLLGPEEKPMVVNRYWGASFVSASAERLRTIEEADFGAKLCGIFLDKPFHRSDLNIGSLITKVNGKTLTSMNDLATQLREAEGSKVLLEGKDETGETFRSEVRAK
jgi:Do/DeqQ family serine protease